MEGSEGNSGNRPRNCLKHGCLEVDVTDNAVIAVHIREAIGYVCRRSFESDSLVKTPLLSPLRK